MVGGEGVKEGVVVDVAFVEVVGPQVPRAASLGDGVGNDCVAGVSDSKVDTIQEVSVVGSCWRDRLGGVMCCGEIEWRREVSEVSVKWKSRERLSAITFRLPGMWLG